jgi:hypothetical protein
VLDSKSKSAFDSRRVQILDGSNTCCALTPVVSFLQLNLEHPDFFTAVGKHLDALSDTDWKAYLTWNVVHSLSENVREPSD